MRSIVLWATGLIFLAAFVAAVFATRSRADPTWERLRNGGEIRIGHTSEAPYAYQDASGNVTGEAPEVARAVLTRMGISRQEWVRADFGSLITLLRTGRIDMIAAGMFVTPQREQEIAFSLPSYCTRTGLLVQEGNPLDLHSLGDMVRYREARLAVLTGAVEGEEALAAGVASGRIVEFPEPDAAAAALAQGLVQALALSRPSVQVLADKHTGVEPASRDESATAQTKAGGGCGAFGFRRDDEPLLDAFNDHMVTFLGSPEHLALVRPFGFTLADLPPGIARTPGMIERPHAQR